jgi:serine/threonine-protein kinase
MPAPALESFLNCLRRSGLIDEDEAGRIVEDLAKAGVDVRDPKKVAAALVQNGTLTKWQAENLLRGKRRGFMLGKYRLLGLLGRGADSSVYKAEHILMRRPCAIKVLPAKNLSGTAALARFQREARAVSKLDHVNIVRAYDLGRDKDGKTDIHFLVMELVEGESFEERVARDGPLPAVDAAELIRQAAEGLAHAHISGIIHRDVKPANLLVDRDGIVKILDLGLAKMSDILSDDSPVLGTADFLAPEQALEAKTVDARSDIYSLGCTFYFLLCGHAPFAGGTLSERLVRHLFEAPVGIAKRRPELPEDLTAIVHRLIAKNPDERVQTTAELASQLKDWLVQNADKKWLLAHRSLSAGSRAKPGELREADGDPIERPSAVATKSTRAAAPAGAPAPKTGPTTASSPVPVAAAATTGVVAPAQATAPPQPALPELIPVMETGAAPAFLSDADFEVPISPVTRSLMKDRGGRSWTDWLMRASKKLRGDD